MAKVASSAPHAKLIVDPNQSWSVEQLKALGRFDIINVKLDKAGGLTAALVLADAVQLRGFGLMVGCMMGSSLSMAPAMGRHSAPSLSI